MAQNHGHGCLFRTATHKATTPPSKASGSLLGLLLDAPPMCDETGVPPARLQGTHCTGGSSVHAAYGTRRSLACAVRGRACACW
eukprot:scaffold138871_cov118-Phaeocystis_antarctica.AAC.1